jgi:hypothetical protein
MSSKNNPQEIGTPVSHIQYHEGVLKFRNKMQMFKQIVISFAIISSFIINIIIVPHPNTVSYTLYFVVSLVATAPFLAVFSWIKWRRERMERAKSEGDSMSLSSGRDAPDLELGLVGTQDGESGKADGKLVEVVVPQEMDDEELPGDKSP